MDFDLKPLLYYFNSEQTYDLIAWNKCTAQLGATNRIKYLDDLVLSTAMPEISTDGYYSDDPVQHILISRFTPWSYPWCEDYSVKLYRFIELYSGTDYYDLPEYTKKGIDSILDFGSEEISLHLSEYEKPTTSIKLIIPKTLANESIILTFLDSITLEEPDFGFIKPAKEYSKRYLRIETSTEEETEYYLELPTMAPCSMVVSCSDLRLEFNIRFQLPKIYLYKYFDELLDLIKENIFLAFPRLFSTIENIEYSTTFTGKFSDVYGQRASGVALYDREIAITQYTYKDRPAYYRSACLIYANNNFWGNGDIKLDLGKTPAFYKNIGKGCEFPLKHFLLIPYSEDVNSYYSGKINESNTSPMYFGGPQVRFKFENYPVMPSPLQVDTSTSDRTSFGGLGNFNVRITRLTISPVGASPASVALAEEYKALYQDFGGALANFQSPIKCKYLWGFQIEFSHVLRTCTQYPMTGYHGFVKNIPGSQIYLFIFGSTITKGPSSYITWADTPESEDQAARRRENQRQIEERRTEERRIDAERRPTMSEEERQVADDQEQQRQAEEKAERDEIKNRGTVRVTVPEEREHYKINRVYTLNPDFSFTLDDSSEKLSGEPSPNDSPRIFHYEDTVVVPGTAQYNYYEDDSEAITNSQIIWFGDPIYDKMSSSEVTECIDSIMPDPVQLQEIHQWTNEIWLALHAHKFAFDDGSEETPRVANLGYLTERIARVLGISVNSNGTDRSIRQKAIVKKGGAIPDGWEFGQWGLNKGNSSSGQKGGESSEYRDGIVYEQRSNRVAEDKFGAVTIAPGDYTLCENFPQLLDEILDDVDKAIDWQHLGATAIPNADGSGKFATYEGLVSLLTDKAFMLSRISQHTAQTQIAVLIIQGIAYELLKATGQPLTPKSFEVNVGGSQNAIVPYPGLAPDAPTQVEQTGWLLQNIAPILAAFTKIKLESPPPPEPEAPSL